MASFTIQHSRKDAPGELVAALNEGMRRLKSGKWWKNFEKRFGIIGSLNGHDTTMSREYGFHPHKHLQFYSSLAKDQLDRAAFESDISGHFILAMEKQGRYVSAVYGVEVSEVLDPGDPEDLKKLNRIYIEKLGPTWGLSSEITKGPLKHGQKKDGIYHYSPFELLDLIHESDKDLAKWAKNMFYKYALAMKGRHQLQWSRGLRQALGLAREEKTDDELAIEKTSEGDELLIRLELWQWGKVLANDARAELLQAADRGNIGEVYSFLASLGAIQAMTRQIDPLNLGSVLAQT